MKSISKKQDSEKFNLFTSECKEHCTQHNSNVEHIAQSFPLFILHLYFDMPFVEAEEAVRGLGSNDDGLDAFWYSDEHKKCYFIQFKSRKNYNEKETKDAKKEWFSLLYNIEDRLTQQNFRTRNKRVAEIRNLLIEDLYDYESEYHIFHLGDASSDIQHNFSDVTYNSQNDILQKFVEYYEKDLTDDEAPEKVQLEIKLQQSQDFNTTHPYIYFTPKIKTGGKNRKTIVFPISGEQIVYLIRQGTTILDRNVRGYLGDTNAVNKGIIQTALRAPEDFYFYNNGISVTCDKLDVTGSSKTKPTIELTRPQIINGAQTVNSINTAYNLKVKELKKNKSLHPEKEALTYMQSINVLCKIMESNKHTQTKFAKEITQFSNTQNKIKLTDFFSNRPEQITLKEGLLKFGITYNIKRGKSFEVKTDAYINMEDLAENHCAQVDDPFFSKASKIFTDGCEENETSSYTKTFGNNAAKNLTRTKELAKTYFIYHVTAQKLKYIKAAYTEMQSLSNKTAAEIEDFQSRHDTLGFFGTTKSLKYFKDLLIRRTPDPHIDNISAHIFIMDFKILCYIIRCIIADGYLCNRNDEYKSINDYFDTLLDKNNHTQLQVLIESVFGKALAIYGESLKNIFKHLSKGTFPNRQPKTKDSKKEIDQKISDAISDSEQYIRFEFS